MQFNHQPKLSMKVENYLPKSSQEKITAAVKEAEKKVNAEIVPVFMISSDPYVEAKLRGAIMMAAVTAISILAYDHLMGWYQLFLLNNDWLFVMSIAAGGLIGYFLFGYVAALKKLMVSKTKKAQRSLAMAERVFGEYKLFETSQRNGILIFVSLFEHKIEIMPDKGLKEKVSVDEWNKVLEEMKPSLRSKNFEQAFVLSITKITEVLLTNNLNRNGDSNNELPDHVRENL
jgi:putative membrane protein